MSDVSSSVSGRAWNFDNPKLAALVHNMIGADASSRKSVREAAAEAGFRLPPPDHDIGTPVSLTDLKPGFAVMGPHSHNAVYLGELRGTGWVITEHGEVIPLDEFPAGDGPHEGLFRLGDNGGD